MNKIDTPHSGMVATCVTWLDASVYSGWHRGKDAIESEPLEITSVGWLVSQDDTSVVLAMSANSHCQIGDVLVIPAQSVVVIKAIPPNPKGDT